MSLFKKTMLYLGLGPDEEYDEHYQQPAAPPQRREPDHHSPQQAQAPAPQQQQPSHPSAPRKQRQVPSGGAPLPEPEPRADSGVVRVIPADSPVVKAVPAPRTANPSIVAPESFNDAQKVGDAFKGDQPVIINLQGAERDLTRRLVDFASGLCYALGGKMEKVANSVYLLTPEAVEVTAEDRRRITDGELTS